MIELGLFLILLAWLWQVALIFKNEKGLSNIFAVLYSIGLLLLVIKGFNFGPTFSSYLNMGTLALSTLVVILLKM